MRLAFVTSGLGPGGAEMMLYKLLMRLDRQRHEPAVFSLRGDEVFVGRLREAGVAVHTANLGGPGGGLPGLLRLRQQLAGFRPHLLQGWMYHGNAAAWLAAKTLSPRPQLAWSVRQSLPDLTQEHRGTALVVRACARLSGQAAAIVYNASQAARDHEAVGFNGARTRIIPNGFDTMACRPSAAAHAALRHELGLPEGSLLVGMVGRYHPVKNHAGFLAAAQTVAQALPAVHFVLAGQGVSHDNTALAALVAQHGLLGRCHLLGERRDIHRVTAAFDVAVCASFTEGFPNVVGEAMACAVPSVVTDVGDCATIVGDTGLVVPPHDTPALAAAMHQLLAAPAANRAALGLAARQRIERDFSIDAVTHQYETLFASLASKETPCAASMA